MDWLPFSERLFDFWPFIAWGAVKHHDDEQQPEEVEIHSPGDRWGWIKLGGNSTLIVTQFIVVAIVAVQFEIHERHAAERGMTTLKAHEASENLLLIQVTADNKQTRELIMVILKNQGELMEAARESTEENRNQTYIMTLTERQRQDLDLVMPESLKERRKRR